ncbi:MAG: xanthine dehydrogenase family protein molybdopterin-binding subunit [Acidobacteriaceae bacterium]|nr:xanthine dehydrogenase family protein molybdopterin-binding subunit [Acidobacteriaceae bacterium]
MLSRRSFLESLGGGLLVLWTLDEQLNGQESGGSHRHGDDERLPQDVAAWLHLSREGVVTVFTGKAEVGQNIRTSLTQAVADELRVQPAAVRLVMGDTARTPWDMGTFGSRTTPQMAPQLRKMAVMMREQLIIVAAQDWHIPPSSVAVRNGSIVDLKSGREKTYGSLASTVDWTKIVGTDGKLSAASDWQCAGKSLPKINASDFVTGKHKFSSDMRRPNMLYGRVLRPAAFNAKLATIDTSAAERMAGVTVVRDADFVGVAAENEWAADQALRRITAKWDERKQISSNELFSFLKANPEEATERSNDRPPAAGGKEMASTYTVAYIAHVPLEPRAAVAEWDADSLTVWTGTQRPFGVRSDLAQAFHLPENRIRVIVPDTGSAYGGKHTGECAMEAARLAKGAGRPVKVVWSREEEFTWAYFRPAGVIEVESVVADDGTIQSWKFDNYNSGPSGLDSPYKLSWTSTRFHETRYPLRQGSYRGLAATANHFARESHIDEIAAALGMDPLAFRLKNLKEDRVRAVLEAAANKFEWSSSKRARGHGYGLACGMEKGSFFACAAEVSVSPERKVRVERVVEAFECGAIVNPEHLQNQVEGAILMGLGGALSEAIRFADGRILNARLSEYPVPRFSDAPAIECVLLDRKDLPSAGAGETPIMGVAPAIANALFQATGVRVRSMPIAPAFGSSNV